MEQRYLQLLAGKELQEFIVASEHSDEQSLILKKPLTLGAPSSIVADQISGRRKAKLKLPSWYRTPGIVYPPSVSLEQCSSELTAKFKRLILDNVPYLKGPANRGADLTGGFGVDSFFFSPLWEKLDYIEPDGALAAIARHNHEVMGAVNVQYHVGSAEKFLSTTQEHFAFIFIDPSRRSASKRVFRLTDSEPDVLHLLPSILERTDLVLVKTSPLMDLQQGIKELGRVNKIFVVAVDNDCKEVLFLCSREPVPEPEIICVNLSASKPGNDWFTFSFAEEQNSISKFSNPLAYLYEPDAAVLKAGAFKLIGQRYGLSKLAKSTHLYTSASLVENFPGRIFSLDPDSRAAEIRSSLPEGKANVVTRNYPLSPEQIRKKFKIADGGDRYVIGFSGEDKKFLMSASRLK